MAFVGALDKDQDNERLRAEGMADKAVAAKGERRCGSLPRGLRIRCLPYRIKL